MNVLDIMWKEEWMYNLFLSLIKEWKREIILWIKVCYVRGILS